MKCTGLTLSRLQQRSSDAPLLPICIQIRYGVLLRFLTTVRYHKSRYLTCQCSYQESLRHARMYSLSQSHMPITPIYIYTYVYTCLRPRCRGWNRQLANRSWVTPQQHRLQTWAVEASKICPLAVDLTFQATHALGKIRKRCQQIPRQRAKP